MGWGGGESGSSSGQETPTGCQCIFYSVLKGRKGGLSVALEFHSCPLLPADPQVGLHEAREKSRLGVSAASRSRRQCAQCAGTREAEPGRDSEASSSWGQARLPAPTPDKERPGPGELAAFPPLGAPGGGSPAGRQGGEALSNSAAATAGQAVAWQPVRRRQGWRA